MATPKVAAGSTICIDIVFREFPAGPYIDPADARFDVLDPADVLVESDTPTTIVISPGRHKGCYTTDPGAQLGVWTMRFQATINGSAVEEDCEFEIVAAGSIEQPSGLQGPCEPWPIDDTCITLPDDTPDALVTRMTLVATELLWAATGRRYGLCQVTVRPCLDRCRDGSWGPERIGGEWYNRWCGCTTACSCTELCRVLLPGPVHSVDEVTIGADTLDPSEYVLRTVDGLSYLLRISGCFPSCQNLGAACGEEGAFCVTYTQGLPVPQAGIEAVSELTEELVKACLPNCDCRLPRNIQQKTRQGVTIVFDRTQTWIMALPAVGMFIQAVNPKGLSRSPTVWSPDLPPLIT